MMAALPASSSSVEHLSLVGSSCSPPLSHLPSAAASSQPCRALRRCRAAMLYGGVNATVLSCQLLLCSNQIAAIHLLHD